MNHLNYNISNGAFVLLVCNLRLFLIVEDCGFHQTQRHQLYIFTFHFKQTIGFGSLWINEVITSRGTRAKNIAKLATNTVYDGKYYKYKLRASEKLFLVPLFNVCLHHQII